MFVPAVRVGLPRELDNLAVFPLFWEGQLPQTLEYQLAEEAFGSKGLRVEEIDESGSVPELRVCNQSNSRVLLLEGEQLIGAKQNRILNTTVLVPAKSELKIPVSCVEQGRWRYTSSAFSPSDHYSPSKLRCSLKSSVSRSLRSGSGHGSDQGEVWSKVSSHSGQLNVVSQTGSMDDSYLAHNTALQAALADLPYVEGATGMAIALGDRIVAVDLFDKPPTCQKVWRRLLSGVVLESLSQKKKVSRPQVADAESFVSRLNTLAWKPAPAVGEGSEFRAEASATQASALAWQEAPIHVSMLAS